MTANEVGGGSGSDQNAVTTTTYDAWGRALTVADPDSMTTTTVYAANKTDVASENDGLNTTTYPSYDAIGQRLSVVTPLSETTTTDYDYFGNVTSTLLPAAPNAVTNKSTYDGAGRKTADIVNWVDGTPSSGGIDDLKTTFVLDVYGRVTDTLGDDGSGGGFIKAKSSTAYDLQGNPTSQTTYADTAASDARTVTTYYDAGGSAIASKGPIAPTGTSAPACPGGGYCNEVRTLDFNGQVIATTDAYGKKTRTLYDLSGRPVQVVANPVGGGSASDENVTTEKRYDTLGRVTQVSDPLGRATSTTYDGLDRITRVTRPDSSWTDTVFSKAGRTDRASSTTWTGDTGVAWTKNVYDAAGRQTTTIANWDSSANATYALKSFEPGGTTGWTTSGTPFITSSGASLTNDGCTSGATCLHGTGARSGVVSVTGSGQGAKLALPGTFAAGRTYRARIYAKVDSGSATVNVLVGAAEAGSRYATNGSAVSLTSSYTAIDVSWANAASETTVFVAIRTTISGSATIRIDDVQVWDEGTGGSSPSQLSIPTRTVYDANGRVVASIVPPTRHGGAPLITRTTYDALGRTTKVSVNEIVGAGTADTTSNLATQSAFDALGRETDRTDPSGTVTRFAYDRLGRLTATTQAYVDGTYSGAGTTGVSDITTTYGRNALGELTSLCSASATVAGCSAASGSDSRSWRFAFDDGGNLITQVAPDNSSVTDMATRRWTYDAGGRLKQACDHAPAATDCSDTTGGATRYTIYDHDDVGRQTTEDLYEGATGSGTAKFGWVHTYDAAGQRESTTYDDAPGGSATETWTFTYDGAGRADEVKKGGVTVTEFAWNGDDTLDSRIDPTGTSNFTYDWADRQITAGSGVYTSGSLTWAWGLDGLLTGRTWPVDTSVATLNYDAAKRPTAFTETANGTPRAEFTKTYDRDGSTTSEGRTIPSASGNAGGNTQSFTYDDVGRLFSATLNSQTTSYAYDANGNRTSIDAPGSSDDHTFAFDATDVPAAKTVGGAPLAFTVDAYGNLTGAAEGTSTSLTTYTYDKSDHLTSIDPPGTDPTATLTVDAFGRIGTRTVSGVTETLSYLGTTDAVLRIDDGTTLTDAAITAKGDRTAVKAGSVGRFTLPDLHGNTAASILATTGATTEALRYDAWGELVDAWPGSGSASAFARWKFQGNLDVSPNSDALYENGFRFYAPGLGTFTQVDTLIGQAEDPLSTNRYLYAGASPWTLTDPSGHMYVENEGPSNSTVAGARAAAKASAAKHRMRQYHQRRRTRYTAVDVLDLRKRMTPGERIRENNRVGGLWQGKVVNKEGRKVGPGKGLRLNRTILDPRTRVSVSPVRPDIQVVDLTSGLPDEIIDAKSSSDPKKLARYAQEASRKYTAASSKLPGGPVPVRIEGELRSPVSRQVRFGRTVGASLTFVMMMDFFINGPPTIQDFFGEYWACPTETCVV